MFEERFMQRALCLAKQAFELGEVPVGAVIVRDGEIIAEGKNLRESGKNALLHAELSAIDAACKKLGGWRLSGCEMYVTLEPCPMCAGAIVNARIENVYFGSFDRINGCAGSVLNLFAMPENFRPVYSGGHLEDECTALMKSFFERLREKNKKVKKAMTVSMIVAKGNNNEIGGDNKLLWHISSDLKFFKATTMGKAVIMGRKTFESLPKALPGRKNIVITRNSDLAFEGATVVNSIEDAVKEANTEEVFIIGGESVYAAFMNTADKLYVTEVDIEKPEADAFFPEIPEDDFTKEVLDEGSENGLKYKHILYSRKDK